MADQSRIEWTETTWNPITGCTRISEGCDHCYIERTMPFRKGKRRFDQPGVGGTTGVFLHPERLDQPLHWDKPRLVFVNSLADLFHRYVPNEFIADVFARMWWSPQHTFQVLTKRPARMRAVMPRILEDLRRREHDLALVDCPTPLTWPLPNVWLGVSVESQRWADIRIPSLLGTPAAVRWLSCEPLLGPVDLAGFLPHPPDAAWYPVECRHGYCGCPVCDRTLAAEDAVGWVVAGGESGPGARPMHPAWARTLRDQCIGASVPFFFKQWGEWLPLLGHREYLDLPPGKASRAWSRPFGDDDVTMCHVGKRLAGRLLDGRAWDQYPANHAKENLRWP